jgi:hypothetical protein
MFWKTTALLACAVLAMGAAHKPAPEAPASAPAKPPAAAPAPAKPAAKPEEPFDARDPASLVALLATVGAKGVVSRREDDAVMVTVTSAAANFSAQYAGCNAQGRVCKAVLFDNMIDQPGPAFAQLNAFNQTSAMCRGYEDRSSKPHVIYSTLLFEDDGRDRMKTQVAAWTGCIAEFRNFLKDPNGYLASAP